jgi:hypothetical protein
MTIPIYIGATKIADFFNPAGIIRIPSPQLDTLDKIISDCSEVDYSSRLPAVLENYNKVIDFVCIEDYLWMHYQSYFL